MKKVPDCSCFLTNKAKTSAFFSFSCTDQPVGEKKKPYKTFRDTTSTVKCHHTDKWTYIQYSVGFHWGLPMKLCNRYRKTINAHKHTHTISLEDTWGKDIKDNNTSHMKPSIEKEV